MRAFLFSLIFALTAFAQTTDPVPDILNSLKDGYNRADPSVFTKYFNAALKKEWTDAKLYGFFKNAPIGWGKLNSFSAATKQEGGKTSMLAKLENENTRLSLTLDKDGKLADFQFHVLETADFADPLLASVFIRFPLKEVWRVAEGGGTKELNAHHDSLAQAFAMDFVRFPESTLTEKESEALTNGQEILSPVGGLVSQVLDGIPENAPGRKNTMAPDGNALALRYGPNEFVAFTHLKIGSFSVKSGEKVVPGQPLARVGLSGDVPAPILTLNVQDNIVGQKAHGFKFGFACVEVYDGKAWTEKVNYHPVKGDILRICPEAPKP